MTAKTPEEKEVELAAKIEDQRGRLFGLAKPKSYEGDPWLFNEIRKFVKARVELEDERHYSVIAACVLHSYRVRENRTTPYLFLTGPTGTGKNRILHILRALCYRGFIAGNPTAASLFRLMDVHHPTLCVDEAEKLAPFRRNPSESVQAIQEVLNLGYCQDQFIVRADAETSLLHMFDPFGFKAIASTTTLPDTTLGRCIVIVTDENVDTNIPVAFEPEEANELRDYLERYSLVHDKTSPLYRPPEKTLTFEDLKLLIPNYRVIEIFGPLYKVTPSPIGQKHILELAQEASDDRREERGSGYDGQVLEALLKTRQFEPTVDRYPIAAIAKVFNEGLEKWETKTPDWMGKRIRSFGLKPCRVGERNLHGIFWNEKKLLRRFKRYGLVPLDSVTNVRSVSSQSETEKLPNTSPSLPKTWPQAQIEIETNTSNTSNAPVGSTLPNGQPYVLNNPDHEWRQPVTRIIPKQGSTCAGCHLEYESEAAKDAAWRAGTDPCQILDSAFEGPSN